MGDCELCEKRAWMYCEADQAKLCWHCDEKVHGANFLAAKHSRILLCRVCQSPTAWQACGAKLTRTASVCEQCVTDHSMKCDQHLANDDKKGEEDGPDDVDHRDYEDDNGDYDSGNDHNVDDNDNEKEEEEEGENQVVPWSSAPSSLPPPPPLASSSNSDADGDLSSPTNGDNLAVKVVRENSLLDPMLANS